MRWGKKEVKELPKELEEIEPDDIVKRLNQADEFEKQLNTLNADKQRLEADVTTNKTELESVRTKLAELEANASHSAEAGNKTGDGKQEPANFLAEPERWFNEQNQGTQAVAIYAGMMSAKLNARQGLSTRDAKIFNKYEKEIDQVVNSSQPMQRIMPQTWANALIYIKGLKEDEIRKAERDQSDYFSESATQHGTVNNDPDKDKNKKPEEILTPEQLTVAKKLNVTPERYLAQLRAMQVVSQ